MKVRKFSLAALAALAALCAHNARADTINLVSDGTFESYTQQVKDAGGLMAIQVGWANTPFDGWSTAGYSIYLADATSPYGTVSGVSVVLSGYYGTISQTFQAVAGATYTLSFDSKFQGNPVTVAGQVGDNTVVFAADSGTNHTLSWTATNSGQQTVALWSSEGLSGNGNLVDNISLTSNVSAVPEPASGALLLAGIGCIAWVARRRSSS